MPGNALDDNVQANDDEEQTSDRSFSDILHAINRRIILHIDNSMIYYKTTGWRQIIV